MNRWIFKAALVVAALSVQSAFAGQVLNDWCVNVDGDIGTACNGAGSGGTVAGGSGATINLANMDLTLMPTGNNLGSITTTFVSGTNQYVSFYADYDVDYDTSGSFGDSVSVHGALPSGWAFSANDPNNGNLFADFASNTLDNTNSIGVYSGPPNICCDAATVLSVGLPIDYTGTVTFTVSDTAPLDGFYLQQTNGDTGNSIYISGQLTGGVPEPSTFGLALGAFMLTALVVYRRRRLQF